MGAGIGQYFACLFPILSNKWHNREAGGLWGAVFIFSPYGAPILYFDYFYSFYLHTYISVFLRVCFCSFVKRSAG
jgi:hypothetical protein